MPSPPKRYCVCSTVRISSRPRWTGDTRSPRPQPTRRHEVCVSVTLLLVHHVSPSRASALFTKGIVCCVVDFGGSIPISLRLAAAVPPAANGAREMEWDVAARQRAGGASVLVRAGDVCGVGVGRGAGALAGRCRPSATVPGRQRHRNGRQRLVASARRSVDPIAFPVGVVVGQTGPLHGDRGRALVAAQCGPGQNTGVVWRRRAQGARVRRYRR
eukprot:ctg_897.g374